MVEKKDLNTWNLHQVFVQSGLVKGYRYLDLSGVVLNRIGDLYEEIGIDPAGGVLKKRKNIRDPYAIRFSTEAIWLQYAPIESLEYVVDTAHEWINSIAKDIEVRNFRTLGVRSHYFVASTNIIKSSTLLARKISGDILQDTITDVSEPRDVGLNYMVRVPVKNFIAVVRAQTIRVVREAIEPVDYPSDGLLFDVDIYWRKEGPNLIPRAETKGFVRSAADLTYDLLEKIGYKLLEGNHGKDK